MDPALLEILRKGTTGRGDEVEAIIRLDRPNEGVAGVRIVSRFGPIATCRLHRDSIISTRQADRVVSLKAPRLVGPEYGAGGRKRRSSSVDNDFRDSRRPSGMRLTGAGVVVGVIDWGCDFDHPNFKHTDGSTRLVSLWDQRGPTTSTGPRPYGYGAVYGVRQIDDALRAADPYDALGYHPAEADPDGSGAHGTHVMDIAAGNGLGGSPLGIAPEADLVFVHLADPGTSGLANLGNSVRILEAVDFISRVAGGRSWVINSGVGRHGGPHDGTTLAEQALDYTLTAAPGRFIVQSAGNYFDKSTHASGQLASGQMRCLTFVTHEAGVTANEVEVWYSGDDELAVRVESPTGERTPWVPCGGQEDVLENDRVVGRVYHRARDPNNGDNHVELFLDPWARSGSWEVSLQAWTIRNGTFHAWLERDEASVQRQSHFVESDVDRTYTTGTIANGHLPLVVGAYDAHLPTREVAPFSSAGPTRDGRSKPDLVAPGVQVLAARSAPLDSSGSPGLFARKSGTSMAAPHVAGVVALCLQGAPRRLAAEEIRDLLLSNVERVDPEEPSSPRFGRGCLSVGNVVAAVSSPRRDV